MDIEYVDILTGKNLSSIQISTIIIMYLLVRSSTRRERDGENEVGIDVCIVTLASYKYHFIRVNGNLVQHPSNNKSINLS